MKKTLAVTLAVLTGAACLAAPAQALKGPVVYNQARAIPTRSGENVRITLYTKRVKRIKIAVDDSRLMKGISIGTGCGKRKCQKWKVYAERRGDECYKLEFSGNGELEGTAFAGVMTACEPFRDGEI